MLQKLIDLRNRAMDTAEKVRDDAWPERTGDAYIKSMSAVVNELLEISKELEKIEAPLIERIKTIAYTGTVLSELEPAIGIKALKMALKFFKEAESLLTGEESPTFIASLNFNYANTIRQCVVENIELLLKAWEKTNDTITIFEQHQHPRLDSAVELKEKVEGTMGLPIILKGFDSTLPEYKEMIEHLEKSKSATAIMPMLLLAMHKSGGSKVVITRIMAAIEELPEGFKQSPGFTAVLEDVREISASLMAPEEAELFDKLKQTVEKSFQEEDVDSNRKESMNAMLDQLQRTLSQGFASNPIETAKSKRQEVGDLMDSQLRSLHYAERPPEGSRAYKVHDLCFHIKKFLTEDRNHAVGDEESTKRLNLTMDITKTSRKICNAGADNNTAIHLERNEFRPVVYRIRKYASRYNPMLVHPKWGKEYTVTDPNTIYFSGDTDLRMQVDSICRTMGYETISPSWGGDNFSLSLWKQLQRAMTCIFYINIYDHPAKVAARAYELGIASTLGKARVVVTPANQTSLFDIDFETIELSEVELLDNTKILDAIDASFHWFPYNRHNIGLNNTYEFAKASYSGKVLDAYAQIELQSLTSESSQQDPLVFKKNLDGLLTYDKTNKFRVIHPVWPATYPKEGKKQLFHITRLNPQEWLNDNSEVIRKVCKSRNIKYLRCDEPSNRDIIKSIWEGIAESTHILADFTAFNANVALELGIAHTLGKPILLAFNTTDDQFKDISEQLKEKFPAISRERYHEYRNAKELKLLLESFL